MMCQATEGEEAEGGPILKSELSYLTFVSTPSATALQKALSSSRPCCYAVQQSVPCSRVSL
jgi:hypothetical protein